MLRFMDEALADVGLDSMNRGDFLTIALKGDFVKPRPALVVQSDQFNAHAIVTVLLVTSTLVDAPLFRVSVQPGERNGLKKPSQMIESYKLVIVYTNKIECVAQ